MTTENLNQNLDYCLMLKAFLVRIFRECVMPQHYHDSPTLLIQCTLDHCIATLELLHVPCAIDSRVHFLQYITKHGHAH